jgi:type II protein arginine methyltransferase
MNIYLTLIFTVIKVHTCFTFVIQINPDYSAARQNLENVCSHLVERWHFRMLNDVRRNCAYKIAIRRAAQRGHRSMIDIGCGTGILRYEKYIWILL